MFKGCCTVPAGDEHGTSSLVRLKLQNTELQSKVANNYAGHRQTKLCRASTSTRYQRNNISRHATVKLNIMQQSSGGDTPTGFTQHEWGPICYLFDLVNMVQTPEFQCESGCNHLYHCDLYH